MRHMAVVRPMREIIQRGEIGEVKAVWCRHFVGNGGDYYFKDWHAERAQVERAAAAEGRPRHRRHPLARRRVHDPRSSAMGDLTVYGDVADRRDNSDRTMPEWFDLDELAAARARRELNPVIDVEDLSMVLMALDNGVLASYEQCHFTPDYWRNYTVIGTEGRLENFGDTDGGVVRVWNSRTTYEPDGRPRVPHRRRRRRPRRRRPPHGRPSSSTSCARTDPRPRRRPIAARNAVATAVAATESLRDGIEAPRRAGADASAVGYFAGDQRLRPARATAPTR